MVSMLIIVGLLLLFHFFLVDHPPADDENEVAKVDPVPVDLISVVISDMMDLPMVVGIFVMRR